MINLKSILAFLALTLTTTVFADGDTKATEDSKEVFFYLPVVETKKDAAKEEVSKETPAPVVNANGTKVITLTSDNTLVLRQAFSSASITELISKTRELDSKLQSDYPIYLVLYTPGGSVQAGLEYYDFVKTLNRPIHTVTMFAASMGFQTVQQLGNRYILQNGVLMAHQAATGGLGGEFSRIQSRFDIWVRRVEEMDRHTATRTKGKYTYEQFTYAYQNELWLTGTEAVREGFADEVVVAKCDNSLSGSYYFVVETMFGSLKVGLSKCPLNTGVLSVERNILTNKGMMSLTDAMVAAGHLQSCKDVSRRLYDANKLDNVICVVDPDFSVDKAETMFNDIIENYNSKTIKSVIYYQ